MCIPHIPLGVHSHFSLMQGTASPHRLCHTAKNLGFNTVGLTDINNVYGLWSYLDACEEFQITPIIGADVFTPDSRFFCLAKNITGYRNMCSLLSKLHCSAEFNLKKILEQYYHGLVILPVTTDLLIHCVDIGADTAAALMSYPNQENNILRKAAQKASIPAVAMNVSFFPTRNDYFLYQTLHAIKNNSTLDKSKSLPQHLYLASPSEFSNRFNQWPETLKNSFVIGEKCTFRGPDFGLVLPPSDYDDSDKQLEYLAFAGAGKRYGTPLPKNVTSRLRHELDIISKMSFSSYFLVVNDIIGPINRTCGRGSGAASIVSYCLFITNVCPVKHNLYFERFLNLGRTDAPDIDVDFAWDERDAILHNVLNRFKHHSAMVCNHVLLQPRMAVREVAKIFGLPGNEISRVNKKLPWIWRGEYFGRGGEFTETVQSLPQMQNIQFPDPWPQILTLAAQISGTPRNLSVHPGGIIITPDPISQYVPIEYAPKGVPIIQWEKDGAETAGLVKIDLLGNRSLAVIRDTVHSIRRADIHFNEEQWSPEDDVQTKNNIAKGNTMGCFYIESPATKLLQKKAKIGDFEHVVIHSSIIRPAANEFIREYLRRLHGGAWKPLHPLIGDVLQETYGIMVYQDDVSRVAVKFGFTPAEGDKLRKILSKKDKYKKLKDLKKRFFAKAAQKQVDPESTEKIWQMMMSFDGYSFCKPHSASYAQVSFQAAFLKTHHPAHFMAAVLSNRGGFYSTFAYVSEAKRLGLQILPPDVNQSEIAWIGTKKTLRVGFQAVHGLTAKTMMNIAKQRDHKKYVSLSDFLSRVNPDKNESNMLLHSGAFDSLCTNKNSSKKGELYWQLMTWEKNKKRMQPTSLFSQPEKAPALPEPDPLEQLRNEYRSLGFLCSRHPITLFAKYRHQLRTTLASDITSPSQCHPGNKRTIRFLGWPITGKVVGTKKGETMEFLSFEDETGQVECTFFPQAYKQFSHLLHGNGPLLLEGYRDQEFGVYTLTVGQAADGKTNFRFKH